MCSCRGYIRNQGLSANQLIHIPGAGDFQIARIGAPAEPELFLGAGVRGNRRGNSMEVDKRSETDVAVLATPDPTQQEALVRENVPDPLAGEQTWPTEEVRAD